MISFSTAVNYLKCIFLFIKERILKMKISEMRYKR